jgi:hypothetical protein
MAESFALGVLATFISGLILYLARQQIRADRLRVAIATEIRRSTPVGSFKTARMGKYSLETPIIDANLGRIDLLTTEEIALIANYHRHMARVRQYNEQESADDRISISRTLAETGSDLANNTADTLESNVSLLTKLLNVFNRGSNRLRIFLRRMWP